MNTRDILKCPHFQGEHEPDRPPCIREEGHDGEHLGQEAGGMYVIWWRDIGCDCAQCRSSNEPADWCEPFSHVTKDQAERLITSRNATILDWSGSRVRLKEDAAI